MLYKTVCAFTEILLTIRTQTWYLQKIYINILLYIKGQLTGFSKLHTVAESMLKSNPLSPSTYLISFGLVFTEKWCMFLSFQQTKNIFHVIEVLTTGLLNRSNNTLYSVGRSKVKCDCYVLVFYPNLFDTYHNYLPYMFNKSFSER